nr:ATP-NAD kinase family protein [Staphylothermus hellenicus]
MTKNIRMGFIVNPIAGMGGRVGLKGTDGEAYYEALRRGAKPVSPIRALEFLNNIRIRNIQIITAPKPMGEDIVRKSSLRDKLFKIINSINQPTTPEDTRRIAKEMMRDIDILVFVGGDGTARDILEAVDKKIPVLGVPAGVKMYSAVFATTPRDAAMVIEDFVKGNVEVVEREVLDIDEEAFRRDKLVIKLYGYLLVPVSSGKIQASKTIYHGFSEEENKIAIARYIIEHMDDDTVYILGPGSTVKTINKLLGIDGTILGVDVIYRRKLIAKDVGERELLEIINKYNKAMIIVSPIGGQGFVFGRGNQQISPEIIRLVGRENILIVSTWRKISSVKVLRVDTGDDNVDAMLKGYWKVLVDYNRFIVKKVV